MYWACTAPFSLPFRMCHRDATRLVAAATRDNANRLHEAKTYCLDMIRNDRDRQYTERNNMGRNDRERNERELNDMKPNYMERNDKDRKHRERNDVARRDMERNDRARKHAKTTQPSLVDLVVVIVTMNRERNNVDNGTRFSETAVLKRSHNHVDTLKTNIGDELGSDHGKTLSNQGYLIQMAAAIHKLLRDTTQVLDSVLFICNVDIEPDTHTDAMFLSDYVTTVQRFGLSNDNLISVGNVENVGVLNIGVSR
jgi:hypothetical protein